MRRMFGGVEMKGGRKILEWEYNGYKFEVHEDPDDPDSVIIVYYPKELATWAVWKKK